MWYFPFCIFILFYFCLKQNYWYYWRRNKFFSVNNNYNFHIQKNKIYSIEIDLLSVYNYEAHMMRISICSEPDIEKRKRVNTILKQQPTCSALQTYISFNRFQFRQYKLDIVIMPGRLPQDSLDSLLYFWRSNSLFPSPIREPNRLR